MSSPSDKQFLEDVIRGENADAIADLPDDQKPAAQMEEELRQGQWEKYIDSLLDPAAKNGMSDAAAKVDAGADCRSASRKDGFWQILSRKRSTDGP
jgi:hypothetical protein